MLLNGLNIGLHLVWIECGFLLLSLTSIILIRFFESRRLADGDLDTFFYGESEEFLPSSYVFRLPKFLLLFLLATIVYWSILGTIVAEDSSPRKERKLCAEGKCDDITFSVDSEGEITQDGGEAREDITDMGETREDITDMGENKEGEQDVGEKKEGEQDVRKLSTSDLRKWQKEKRYVPNSKVNLA